MKQFTKDAIKNETIRAVALSWWNDLSEDERYYLTCKHFVGIPVTTLTDHSIESMYHYEHITDHPTPTTEGKEQDILTDFINEIKNEFKDENWDYLEFIADRVRQKQTNQNK